MPCYNQNRKAMDTKTLCADYAPYDHRERLEKLFRDFDRVLITSSFGTTSAILLHFLHQVRPDHPVHFIDTGYHFLETHQYRETLSQEWGLNVVTVRPKANEHNFTRLDYTWTYQPDSCCFVNKVSPVEKLKESHDVWISGMIRGTSANRKNVPLFKESNGIMRFYPLADMDPEEAQYYNYMHELPDHPLKDRGYGSVGCTHCTQAGEGRSGRWSGSVKTECGLHSFKS
ncbi:MAG: phosphoadenylyl-sulfate reductase [Bacteroidota bacterium]